jgi:hypothetical protein
MLFHLMNESVYFCSFYFINESLKPHKFSFSKIFTMIYLQIIISLFSGLRTSMHMNERRKFLYYVLYAVGSPLLFLALILSIDFELFIIPKDWRPDVGGKRCFLSGKWSPSSTQLFILIFNGCKI